MSRFYTINDNGIERQYVSVTTALGILEKPYLIRWSAQVTADYLAQNFGDGRSISEILAQAVGYHELIKTEAATTGSFVHHLIERYIKGQHVVVSGMSKEIQNAFIAFINWKRENKVEFLHTEKTVWSNALAVAGTCDAVVKIGGEIKVVDFKCSSAIQSENRLQVAIYRECLRQMGIETDGEMILRLDKKTGIAESADYSKNHSRNLESFKRLLEFYYLFKSRRLKNNPRTKECELALAA